jgi:PTS system nitrogen regulatory IIA component
MTIADIIHPERVRIVADVQSKKRALERLSEILAEATPYLAATEIFTALIAREKLGSTGIGDGVAIPHGRLKSLDACVGAMIVLGEGVDFEAPDDRPVDLMFGLLVPQDSTEIHLKVLRALAEMFSDEECLARLRAAGDDRTLYDLLLEYGPVAQAG